MEWLTPLAYLSNNPISMAGVVAVTGATVTWFFLLPLLIHGETPNPYVGILWIIDLSVFVLGLVLIPVGIHFRRVRLRKAGIHQPVFSRLTMASPEFKKMAAFIAVTTFANVIIAGQLTYSAVNYMESESFCGQVCHQVMSPEYTAYVQSPHARVACVECHIGPGASWFVKSKLSGMRQVFAVAAHTYPRPLPSPVANLRPARETCERCHWPERFTGDRFLVRTEFAEDEQNSAATTVLILKIGGRTWKGTVGIHGAHMNSRAHIEYVALDERRQTIPQVSYTDEQGKTTVYTSSDTKATPAELAALPRRTMDCMDCHNRPTHSFQLPERAVDEAMAAGRVSPQLPFVKKQALEALKKDYPDTATAQHQIASLLTGFYQNNHQQIYVQKRASVDGAIKAVQDIYARNIFPEMKITWGTYVNNIGHMESPGCFRCHDGNHLSAGGRSIPNDCSTCHDLAAMQEKDPKILKDLGLSAQDHPAEPEAQ